MAQHARDEIGRPRRRQRAGIGERVLRALSRTRPLAPAEIAAAKAVLGDSAIRWSAVRVATGGWLRLAFALNRDRAFALFHTVHLPQTALGRDAGLHEKPSDPPLDLIVHELVHVLQYERVGAVYVPQALAAQLSVEGYDYGGGGGLLAARRAGRLLADFNREQQAQIAQDYFRLVTVGGGTALGDPERQAYLHFIEQLRAGRV